MAVVGTETVEVVPDARGFDEKLKAQLGDLRAQVNIMLNEGEFAGKVAEIKAELDTIRDKHVNVDDDGSSERLSSKLNGVKDSADSAAAGTVGRMALIGTAILAIIPLAAAASIAVAGIGAGIGLGIAGLLVGKLALGGVGSALSASNKPTGGGGTSQAQSLDNQRQAEVALTAAQRNATQAQKDLTQARIDAANALVNLTDQVADNGLAQRQAALDLITAQQNLTTARANPDAQNPANANALAGIQLAYDQAKQNVQDLADAGSQLQQQQTATIAAGVNGAANVVSATNAVTDSQNALVEAQYNVGKASTSAGGGLTAYQQAMQKLGPVQQQFVKFIQSIKPAFDGIKNAAADSFLPKLQIAILALLPVLPTIAKLVGTIGSAFGDLAIKASQALTGPFWTQFLNFIQTNIGPAIDTFGKIFGGLFQLAAGFFQQAYPLIQEFGNAIAGALGTANGGVAGGALGGFFAYIQANAPQIKSTLATVAGSVVSIFQSLAPLAGPALKAISSLAIDLAAVVKIAAPLVKVLLPFAPAIILMVGAFKLLYPVVKVAIGALALFDAEADANPIGAITLAISLLIIGMIELILHFQQVSAFLGGPWGTAISAAVAVVFPFIGIPALIIGHWQALEGFFVGLWKNVTGAITTGVAAVLTFFTTAKSDIGKAWSDIWSSLAAIAIAAFDGVTGAIKSTINGVITLIDDAIKRINSDLIDKANLVPFVNIPHIPAIDHLHAGGPVVAGRPVVVGDGPGSLGELFIPSMSGRVLSHADAMSAAGGGNGARDIVVYEAFNAQATAMTINRQLQFAST